MALRIVERSTSSCRWNHYIIYFMRLNIVYTPPSFIQSDAPHRSIFENTALKACASGGAKNENRLNMNKCGLAQSVRPYWNMFQPDRKIPLHSRVFLSLSLWLHNATTHPFGFAKYASCRKAGIHKCIRAVAERVLRADALLWSAIKLICRTGWVAPGISGTDWNRSLDMCHRQVRRNVWTMHEMYCQCSKVLNMKTRYALRYAHRVCIWRFMNLYDDSFGVSDFMHFNLTHNCSYKVQMQLDESDKRSFFGLK